MEEDIYDAVRSYRAKNDKQMSKPPGGPATFYLASKTEHAPKWRALRQHYRIISSWIDEADKGQSRDLVSLAMRCITEPTEADYTILYCEPGEHLKFALAEVGAALASGKEVYVIGECASISPTMLHHPLCKKVAEEMSVRGLLAALSQYHQEVEEAKEQSVSEGKNL